MRAPPAGPAAPALPPLVARLGAGLLARAAVVARLAAALRMEVWLVGGTVRDLLLGRDSPDLDFVTEGDAAVLGEAVVAELGGRLLRHAAFLTVDVVDGQGVHLDLASARRETYRGLAALPDVTPAGLAEDLSRRDFTVNALALPLGTGAKPPGRSAGEAADEIVDLHGGRRDLAAGVLRVLHGRSFLDDPTRVLRGVRFEMRLGFRFDPATESLARQALAAGAFARLTGGRLRHELELLLAAGGALAGLERLGDLGILAVLHPQLHLDDAARRRLQAAATELAWHAARTPAAAAPGADFATPAAGRPASLLAAPAAAGASAVGPRGASAVPPPRRWLALLLALFEGLDAGERAAAGERLLLAGEDLRLVSGGGERAAAAAACLRRPEATAGEVDAALSPLAAEERVLAASTAGAVVRSWVRRYETEMRPVVLAIGGADLVAAGARPGPAIGHALRATRAALLDGEIAQGGELAYAMARAAAPPEASS